MGHLSQQWILAGARNFVPEAKEAWEEYGIPDKTLNHLWIRLWNQIHSMAIGTQNLGSRCMVQMKYGWKMILSYEDSLESQQHYLWECSQAQTVCKRILRLVAREIMERIGKLQTDRQVAMLYQFQAQYQNPTSD